MSFLHFLETDVFLDKELEFESYFFLSVLESCHSTVFCLTVLLVRN